MSAHTGELPTAPAPLRPTRAGAAAAAAFAAGTVVLARAGVSEWDLFAAAGTSIVVWVAAIDLEFRLLPSRIVLPTAGVLLLASAVFDRGHFPAHVAAAAGAGGITFLVAALRPGTLGLGDVKLALLLGALLGHLTLEAAVLGSIVLAIPGVVLFVREGRPGLKRQLPLGPFLATGALAAILLNGL